MIAKANDMKDYLSKFADPQFYHSLDDMTSTFRTVLEDDGKVEQMRHYLQQFDLRQPLCPQLDQLANIGTLKEETAMRILDALHKAVE